MEISFVTSGSIFDRKTNIAICVAGPSPEEVISKVPRHNLSE